MEYRIIIATGNPDKAVEIAEILEARGGRPGRLKVFTIKEVIGYTPEVDEDGLTLRENAWKKADASRRALESCGADDVKRWEDIVIADDSGLFVDCLGGRPGVRSSRYGAAPAAERSGGVFLTPAPGAQMELLLEEIRLATDGALTAGGCENACPEPACSPRSASFRCYVAISYPDGSKSCAEGVCAGEITFLPAGKNGFGYDPVFYLPRLGRTMAELDAHEKNAVSHRGIAIRNMADDINMRMT